MPVLRRVSLTSALILAGWLAVGAVALRSAATGGRRHRPARDDDAQVHLHPWRQDVVLRRLHGHDRGRRAAALQGPRGRARVEGRGQYPAAHGHAAGIACSPTSPPSPRTSPMKPRSRRTATGRAITTLMLISKTKQIFQLGTTASPKQVDLVASLRTPYQELGRKRAPLNWDEPVKLALWVQNGRIRVFVNGEKQLDFNQVEMPPIDSVEIAHDFYGAEPGASAIARSDSPNRRRISARSSAPRAASSPTASCSTPTATG